MDYYGVNFGGFLSQAVFREEHFRNFITEEDVKKVSDWGFNTIRLPVDHQVISSKSSPDVLREERLCYMDGIIEAAGKSGIEVILDLHKAPGHTFEVGKKGSNNIWERGASSRKAFLSIWDQLSSRYKDTDNTVFEIMNEPVAPDHELWNRLAQECIEVIRRNSGDKRIVVESNQWGQTLNFRHLRAFDDPNIVYSFHFYEPVLVTHQKAEWVGFYKYFRKRMPFPGTPQVPEDVYRKMVEDDKDFEVFFKEQMIHWDKDVLRRKMEPVLEFKEKHDAEIFCGEFGCIAKADPVTRANWLSAVISLFSENDISFAYWNYKNKDFGIYDYTSKYKTNPNYTKDERLDRETLRILQSGIPGS